MLKKHRELFPNSRHYWNKLVWFAKRIIPVYFSSAKGRYQFASVDIFGSHSTSFKAENRLKKKAGNFKRHTSLLQLVHSIHITYIPVSFSRFMIIWFRLQSIDISLKTKTYQFTSVASRTKIYQFLSVASITKVYQFPSVGSMYTSPALLKK